MNERIDLNFDVNNMGELNRELSFNLNSLFGINVENVVDQKRLKEFIDLSLVSVVLMFISVGVLNAGLAQHLGGIWIDHV